MQSQKRLVRNLRKLLDQQDDLGLVEPGNISEALSQKLPLSHSTGRAAFLGIVQQDRILSVEKLIELGMRQRPGPENPTIEMVLGTENSVFTYAAPFRYPETACGFLFGANVEHEHAREAVATPFDSGGVIHHLRPADSLDEKIRFVRDHELPVPSYRSLLALFMEGLFASPWDYVNGAEPLRRGPIPVMGGDWRRWTFEVRFENEIRLIPSLLAVILPVDVASEASIRVKIARWRQQSVDVRIFQASRSNPWQQLQRLSVEFLEEYMGKSHD